MLKSNQSDYSLQKKRCNIYVYAKNCNLHNIIGLIYIIIFKIDMVTSDSELYMSI